MSFDGKTYVVLGASGGVGSAVCRRLADRGARLVCVARASARLDEIARRTDGTALIADATASAEVEGAVEAAAERYGGLDGAVNCVGSILLKPAHLTSDAEWAETIALNLNSSFFLLRASARRMTRGGGSIVLVSTAAVRTGLANHEAIAAAKGGVEGLALSAAATYASRGIRVNCVAPGLVDTPLASRITRNEAALKASEAMHALGRIGAPDEVASAICWLLDPEQSWVTGQVIGVDGGLGSVRSR